METQTDKNHANDKNPRKKSGARLLISAVSIFFSVFIVLIMGFTFTAINTSCSTTGVYGSDDIVSEELTTGQKIQNYVSSPFRLIGGVVIYPLKALFVDFPEAIYKSFDSELVNYADKLNSGTKKEKEEALFFLSYSEDPEAWKIIIIAFQDKDADIQKQAVLSLVKQKNLPEEAVKQIRDILTYAQSDSSVLLSAIYAIGDLGDERDIKKLKMIYEDEEYADVFRSFALLSLAKLGMPEAEQEAVKTITDHKIHPVMYANSLLSIGYCGMKTDEGRKVMYDSLQDNDERIVTGAITGLGIANDFEFLENLLRKAKTSEFVKKKILVVLGEFGGKDKIDLIKHHLNHSSSNEIRQYAIFGLAKARYKPIVEELIKNLQMESPEIISHEKEPETLWVRLWSLGFLFELTGENFGIDYQPWKKWWDSNKEEFLKETDS